MPTRLGSLVVGVVAASLIAACGPNAEQVIHRRACEMYVDVGGGKARTRDEWLALVNGPEFTATRQALNAARARDEASNVEFTRRYGRKLPPVSPITVEAQTDEEQALERQAITKAKAAVSLRLAISLPEVEDSLKTCPDLPVVRWPSRHHGKAAESLRWK